MKTILISGSGFGHPVSDYFKNLGMCFLNNNYKVVFVFDGLYKDYPESLENEFVFYTWKNRRPTKLSDFIYCYKILKKEKPILCISNFGSTNVVSIISFILQIKCRINYIHTTYKAILADANNRTIKQKIFKYRKKTIYAINTHLFTNSFGAKKDTIDHYGVKNNKISVFPLLIPKSSLPLKSYNEREYCISIVGRLHPVKGHKKLLLLFKECLKNYPDLTLKIVGEGYLKNDLIEQANNLKISSNVLFIGSIPNEEINEIFSSSLISVSASIDEAYGLVNIEALREGTPLVCTKTAGSADILLEGENGLFIDLENSLSLCNALDKILNNWEYFSKNSLKHFAQNYDIANINNHYIRIKDLTL